jgi:hypothetical protein
MLRTNVVRHFATSITDRHAKARIFTILALLAGAVSMPARAQMSLPAIRMVEAVRDHTFLNEQLKAARAGVEHAEDKKATAGQAQNEPAPSSAFAAQTPESVLLHSATVGSAEAACSLGIMYEYGFDGAVQDDKKAVEWYQKAVDAVAVRQVIDPKGAELKLYRWQAHCRGLYQTPIAA